MSSGKVDLKVVLLGKEYGGKTSLVERYIHGKFNESAPYQAVSPSLNYPISALMPNWVVSGWLSLVVDYRRGLWRAESNGRWTDSDAGNLGEWNGIVLLQVERL